MVYGVSVSSLFGCLGVPWKLYGSILLPKCSSNLSKWMPNGSTMSFMAPFCSKNAPQTLPNGFKMEPSGVLKVILGLAADIWGQKGAQEGS